MKPLDVKLQQKVNKTMKDYNLISDGDKVLIGLSGGKDSLALVHFLGERSKIFKPRFSVVAAHISMSNISYQADCDYLTKFCEQHNVQLFLESTEFEIDKERDKNVCFLCSWYRRKKLFDIAQREGCNKIALGHHRDDVFETLLMNMMFQGTFATMPPALVMEKMPIAIIRPMVRLAESDLREFAKFIGMKEMKKSCPYERESNRAKVREILERMKQLSPDLEYSMWSAMENIKLDYLPHILGESSLL